jgi:hypothetical protein
VNDAALETEEFSDVAAVVADVLPGGLCVLPYPVLNIWRLAEDVSSVPGLRIPRDADQRSELMSITIPK